MPIQQQQSSRAGLISTIVVLTVLLVGTLVWAFYANTQLTQREGDLKDLHAKYAKVIKDTELVSSPDNENGILSKFQGDKHIPGTLLDAAADERRELFGLIKGSDETNVKAGIDAAKSTVAHTIGDLHAAKLTDLDTNQPLPLVSTIQTLAVSLKDKQKQLEDAIKARDAALASAKQAADAQALALKERDTSVEAANKKAEDAEAKTKALNDTIEQRFGQVTTDTQAQLGTYAQQQQQSAALAAQLQGQIVRKDGEIKKLYDLLAKYRPTAIDVMIRRSGVHILRVENTNTVYIDAGFADRVNPGLTFEVYGKNDGVPKLGDGMSDENLPEGKASLEVVKVGENSSECRVVHLQPGSVITEGDICTNITYDRNVKPVFVVYGNFDMDFNGVWTAGEADQVKAIIKRFGGVVADKISIETDFLVLGKEPEVPVLSKEEEQDPMLVAKRDAAKAALKAYEDRRNQAAEYHIPVLNQSRFLFYTGYFDLAKR